MRVRQPKGTKGSLKWLQHAVNRAPDCVQPASLQTIEWLSPKVEDDYAEYRDRAFLNLLSLDRLGEDLSDFWPRGGPQWDALGRTPDGVVLVEAKSHIAEFFSPASQASDASRQKIQGSLHRVKSALGVTASTDWSDTFYQYTNRLAHLWWLRENGIKAHLLFVSFLHDPDMAGPSHTETWRAVFDAADYALGLPKRHALSKYVLHVTPDIRNLPV